MDYDEQLKMLMKRRSVRDFKPDPIPDEYVDKISEAIMSRAMLLLVGADAQGSTCGQAW
jgi:hypothetical protein